MASVIMDGITQILTPFWTALFACDRTMFMVVTSAFVVSQIIYVITDAYCGKNMASYRALPLIEKKEWQSRVVSTVHACIVFPICLWVLLTDDEYHSNPVTGRSWWADFSMALGVGYFLSDTVLILRYRIPPIIPILCHHVFAGWAFYNAIGTLDCPRWFGTYLLLTEATGPFNNTHWKLLKSGYKDHKITTIVGYIWTINWIVFRLAINPYLLYRVYAFWDRIVALGVYVSILIFTNVIFLVLLNTVYFFTGPFYELTFGEIKSKISHADPAHVSQKKNQVKHRISNSKRLAS